MGLVQTTGKRTETPYELKFINRKVGSLEELQYSLAQSSQFVDTSVMDPALAGWIRDELFLPELADRLLKILDAKGTLADFVMTILSASDYLPQEQQEDAKHILTSGEGLEEFEQREAKADYLESSGRLSQALTEYGRILEDLPEPERKMRARIEHSRGVIFSELFNFGMAAECFRSATRLSDDPDYVLDYLAAVRLYLPQQDYIAFVGSHPELYETSLTLEHLCENAESSYADSAGTKQLARLRQLRAEGSDEEFRRELQATAREMRSNYRTNTGA